MYNHFCAPDRMISCIAYTLLSAQIKRRQSLLVLVKQVYNYILAYMIWFVDRPVDELRSQD